MKVLVTGGAGFLGSHIVEGLLRGGEDVTVLDNLSTGRKENLESLPAQERLRVVIGDIRDRKVLQACIKEADKVVHLAAIASVPYSIRNPSETRDVNVKGTLNLLEECHEYSIKGLVYASSCAVYGEPRITPVNEEHPFSATTPYAQTKIESEKYCQLFHEKYGLETVCLRIFNVYGTNQHNSDYGGVITQFISRLKKHQPLTIFGDGEQSRDFVYADDIAETVGKIIKKPNCKNGNYNLGSGKATTINQLVTLLHDLIGDEDFSAVHVAPRLGDIRHSQADIHRAKSQFGFEPRTDLSEGLRRLLSSERKIAVASLNSLPNGTSRVGNAGNQ